MTTITSRDSVAHGRSESSIHRSLESETVAHATITLHGAASGQGAR